MKFLIFVSFILLSWKSGVSDRAGYKRLKKNFMKSDPLGLGKQTLPDPDLLDPTSSSS